VALSSEQLVAAYLATNAEIRRRVLAYVTAVWSNSPAFRDEDVARIVSRIVPVVHAGQMQVAQLTNAYIGQMAVLAGVTWTPGVIDREAVVGYRGVPAQTVYTRPAVATYTALSKGATYGDAVAQGLTRLQSIASTDMQQAATRQASRSMGGSGFQSFRRVLSGSENCALCAIASTQRYTRGDLLPLHPGCDCAIEPLTDGRDNQVIDPGLLERTHAQIEAHLGASSDRGARDAGLGKTDSKGRPISDYTELVVTNHHGELGPTLGWRSDHFTGPAAIR